MRRCDIIVVGGGTAGTFAALTAAQQKMTVLLLEKTSACGGIGTNGVIAPYYDQSYINLSTEIDARVCSKQENSGFLLPLKSQFASTELLKGELEQALISQGVTIRYGAIVIDVMKSGNRVTGVAWHDQHGNHTTEASLIIDATAEGTLLSLAGAEFLPDRLMDGARQPYARIFAYLQDGSLWNYGGDAGYVHQESPEELTHECLKSAAAQVPESFQETEKRFFYAPLLGIREGRHLKGIETIHFHDLIHEIQCPNPIAWEHANIDTHSMDLIFEEDEFFLFAVVAMQWSTRLNISIPIGTLIPAGVDGILAAGRMLSVDHTVSQAVRMKGSMKHLGAAAGLTAALSIKQHIDVSKVAAQDIIRKFPIPSTSEMLQANEALWLKAPEKIQAQLRQKNPGTAIWSAYLLGGDTQYLRDLLDEPGVAPAHAAFALALLHDNAALPMLRHLAESQDRTLSETLRNEPIREPHGAIAAYLLGYLDDAESFQLLCNIFEESSEFFFTAAAWKSLLRLMERHDDLRETGTRVLQQFLQQERSVPCFRCYCGETCDATEKLREITRAFIHRYNA